MSKIVVIGGGASGMVSAIYAAYGNNEVILLERNNTLGKKILVTGNGRCNYWNKDISLKHYHTSDKDVLEKIITDKNKLEIENFFNRLGIVPKIRDGYFYPSSNQATSVQTSLMLECKLRGVKIFNNEDVLSVVKNGNVFEVTTNDKKIICDKVVLATGSKAFYKNDCLGYDIAKSFGHMIIEPLPALVQLRLNGSFLKEWQGIRTDGLVSLYQDNKLIKKEVGEIQLTDYGISGICIFQLSSLISRGLYNGYNEEIEINFLNNLSVENDIEFIKFMDDRNRYVIGRNISELLDGILNYKLLNLILKLYNIPRDMYWDDMSYDLKKMLGTKLTMFRVNISGTNSFDMAQVCSGGVKLSEINADTMESVKEKGLYIVGELLDVDGECGGFNLGFAWISGYLAGKDMSDNND